MMHFVHTVEGGLVVLAVDVNTFPRKASEFDGEATTHMSGGGSLLERGSIPSELLGWI